MCSQLTAFEVMTFRQDRNAYMIMIITEHECSVLMCLVASVCVSVCLSVML